MMRTLANYHFLFALAGIGAVILSAYVLPNNGATVFTFFALVVACALGVYPLICTMLGSEIAAQVSVAIYQHRDAFSSATTLSDQAIRRRSLKNKVYAAVAGTFIVFVCGLLMAAVATPYLFKFSQWSSVKLHEHGVWSGSYRSTQSSAWTQYFASDAKLSGQQQ